VKWPDRICSKKLFVTKVGGGCCGNLDQLIFETILANEDVIMILALKSILFVKMDLQI
jgi:hypothetical protein